jgi:hypothetical protein
VRAARAARARRYVPRAACATLPPCCLLRPTLSARVRVCAPRVARQSPIPADRVPAGSLEKAPRAVKWKMDRLW